MSFCLDLPSIYPPKKEGQQKTQVNTIFFWGTHCTHGIFVLGSFEPATWWWISMGNLSPGGRSTPMSHAWTGELDKASDAKSWGNLRFPVLEMFFFRRVILVLDWFLVLFIPILPYLGKMEAHSWRAYFSKICVGFLHPENFVRKIVTHFWRAEGVS